MKQPFSEFARLNERELQDFLNNALIIFDTNVLLHLYLFSSQTLKQVFNMLSDIKKQLWMPHKVEEDFVIYVKTVVSFYESVKLLRDVNVGKGNSLLLRLSPNNENKRHFNLQVLVSHQEFTASEKPID